MSRLQHLVENGAVVPGALHRTLMAQLINSMIEGQSNAIGTFTLDASVGSTTVSDNKFQADMIPVYIPITANASAEIGNGTIYISDRMNGSFTVTHANNAQTDRDFIYIRYG